MHASTKKFGELEIGNNVFRDGHIYMVTKVIFHEEDDNLVTVKLGYPVKLEDGFELITELTKSSSYEIIYYPH